MKIHGDLEDPLVRSLTCFSEDSGYNDSSSENGSSEENCCIFGGRLQPTHDCILSSYTISGRGLRTLSPQTFQYMADCVVHLDLSANNITCLPDTIVELKSVRKLNISKNRLKSVPNTIADLINLENLNLSSNDLNEVPESLKRLQKLKVFDLSNNCLQTFPSCLELGLGRLIWINLSHNKLANSNTPPLCLSGLQYLDLSYNSFEFIPLWLFSDKCRSIKELNIAFNFCFDRNVIQNQIISLKCNRSSVLKSLVKLDVSNTGLSEKRLVKNSFLKEFEVLQCLHMGNIGEKDSTFNTFSEISTIVVPLSVSELRIPKVGLAGFPDSFFNLKNLKVLDMSYNYLNWLPDNFGELNSLEELVMTECTLEFLPKTMGQLGKLKKLVLDKNYLVAVQDLKQLQALTWLDLYNNMLEDFPLSLDQLQRLQHLDINYNCVDLDASLDYEVDGRNCLEMYKELQARLRSSGAEYAARMDACKPPYGCEGTNDSSGSSSSSSFLDHSDYNSEPEDPDLVADHSDWGTANTQEEEDWDMECGQGGDDYLDMSALSRSSQLLLLGSMGGLGNYRFGFMPTIQLGVFDFIMHALKDFLYIPYNDREKKVNRGRPRSRRQNGIVDGQFEDAVGDPTNLEKNRRLIDLMRPGFIRSPVAYRTLSFRPCSFLSLGDCPHRMVWQPMDRGYKKFRL